MSGTGWVNVQVKHCLKCKLDYPPEQANCLQCGRVLVEKTLRVEAEKR